jgi:hypothetical protein
MHKRSKHKNNILSRKSLKKHRCNLRRKIKKNKLKAGRIKFINDVISNARKKGKSYLDPNQRKQRFKKDSYGHVIKPIFVNKEAPSVFNLSYDNCVPVIEFINDLKELGKGGKNINIIMENVTEIGEGAISMLLSVINELIAQEILVMGSKPKNKNVNSILEKSGFFRYLKTIVSKDNLHSKNTILRTGSSSTPGSELASEVRKAMETIWGVNARCPRLFGGIFEMYRNSCDHAFIDDEGVIWHLGLSHFEELNLVKFSFVDNGKGIIKTFISGLLKQFVNFFQDNTDILTTAFTDGIESRTGLSWRGKGLPAIYEMRLDNIISGLIVITNDVYIDFDKNIRLTLPVSFSGTYYYWEMDRNCLKSYFI